MSAADRPLPLTTDPETAGFWEAAARHELAVRRCSDCGTAIHLPRARCGSCGSWDTGWVAVAGTGTVHSWTVVDHQVHPAFPVPYTVLLVALDDLPAVRLLGHLDGDPPLEIGSPVSVEFDDLADGVSLPRWRRSDG